MAGAIKVGDIVQSKPDDGKLYEVLFSYKNGTFLVSRYESEPWSMLTQWVGTGYYSTETFTVKKENLTPPKIRKSKKKYFKTKKETYSNHLRREIRRYTVSGIQYNSTITS